MKAWWKQPYINRLQWILEHYEWFGFSEKEGLVVLMIEYLNTCQIAITPALLEQKTGLTKEALDQALSVLCAKKYLELKAGRSSVSFSHVSYTHLDVYKRQGHRVLLRQSELSGFARSGCAVYPESGGFVKKRRRAVVRYAHSGATQRVR